ncbi:MAG: GNAT family N-acetyltransferase [Gemmatimonadetes bacterium]|nr:GNAT family N-acetyltransferase [Gemmatimonadota bacterium]
MRTEARVVVKRLGVADIVLARATFRLMAEVFDEGVGELSEGYVSALLGRADFWAMAALQDARPIGGITAHVLPMTRSEAQELFIYDLAVQPAHQRRGVGRLLVETLCREAAAAGVAVAFVPADVEDDHSVAFYQALGGKAAPVTIFSFEDQAHDPPAVP